MRPQIATYDKDGNYIQREMTDDEYAVYLIVTADVETPSTDDTGGE